MNIKDPNAFESLDPMADIGKYVLPAAAAAVGSMYMDAKHHVLKDISTWNAGRKFRRLLEETAKTFGDYHTLYHALEMNNPRADAFWFEGQTWTFGEVRERADRLAQWFLDCGVKSKDSVAVYMTNSAESYFTVFALAKLGVTNAMINSSLKDATLIHCVTVAGAKLLFCSPDLAENVETILPKLSMKIDAYGFECGSFPRISSSSIPIIRGMDLPPLTDFQRPRIEATDIANLIYTSGTTGNPKACAIQQSFLARVMASAQHHKDNPLRTLSCMPLFHGTTFFTGLTFSVGSGSCFILLRKFSAKTFWRDCYVSGATKILYVGELCRYLLATPKSEYDRKHEVRVASGNGMRGEVWDRFKERFGIPTIEEYYRATEGVAWLDNFQSGFGVWGAGKVGHRGFIGQYLERELVLVRYDPETERPYRDPKTGFCQKVKAGEPGEAIGKVDDITKLTVYLNNKPATEEKLIRNVFKTGDLYQRSGDLLAFNADGWFHFVDRVGDTYRWKGENVAAGEVRDHIASLNGVVDVTIYGLRLDAYDGQAGCAALMLDKTVSVSSFMTSLYTVLRERGLPNYAIPRLIRIENQDIAMNAAFKHDKNIFKNMGFDPAAQPPGSDLYWLDGTVYRLLTSRAWEGIQMGTARL